MYKNPFKVGDKVKCITETNFERIDNHKFGSKGHIYTVDYIFHNCISFSENSHLCSFTRFVLHEEKESFDVLKALREGKKVRRNSWKRLCPDFYYVKASTIVVNTGGNMANYSLLVEKDDWEEYKESLKLGLYWTVREACDYDKISEWTGTHWVIPKTNIKVSVIKFGNKVEGPKYV